MRIKEVIILAGGMGTRLSSAVPDLPKCMAPVKGRPFIDYVISYLQNQGAEKFILSLGYRHEQVTEYFNSHRNSFTIHHSPPVTDPSPLIVQYSIEQAPLGTGGAIKMACEKTTGKNVLVINGDTLFKADINKLVSFHAMCGADCTVSLKPMTDFDRYGVVELNKDYSIQSFNEKQHYDSGLINGGIYVLNAGKFLKEGLPEKFSFEKDYLEKLYKQRRMYGVVQDVYFIDIGIPEDYQRAQKELNI